MAAEEAFDGNHRSDCDTLLGACSADAKVLGVEQDADVLRLRVDLSPQFSKPYTFNFEKGGISVPHAPELGDRVYIEADPIDFAKGTYLLRLLKVMSRA